MDQVIGAQHAANGRHEDDYAIVSPFPFAFGRHLHPSDSRRRPSSADGPTWNRFRNIDERTGWKCQMRTVISAYQSKGQGRSYLAKYLSE